MNRFAPFLKQLPTQELRTCLALLCSESGYAVGLPPRHLETLEKLELTRRHLLGWQPTWLGFGVNNWHRQIEASLFRDPSLPPPEPKEQENGQEPGPDCNHFRKLYFRPGICWCLRPASAHPNHLPGLALQFLHWHNENERLQRLSQVGSGRDPPQLLVQLTSVERALIKRVQLPGKPQQLGDVAAFFVCLVDFFSLKLASDHLQELELVVATPYLTLTWDGRGVARWMHEVELARGRGDFLALPKPGENGVDRRALPCSEFRALLSDSTRCWCGWTVSEH